MLLVLPSRRLVCYLINDDKREGPPNDDKNIHQRSEAKKQRNEPSLLCSENKSFAAKFGSPGQGRRMGQLPLRQAKRIFKVETGRGLQRDRAVNPAGWFIVECTFKVWYRNGNVDRFVMSVALTIWLLRSQLL